MDKKTLVEIMRNSSEYEFDEDVAADRILAALEAEKAGEVVLMSMDDVSKASRMDGVIIFRPTKGDK